MMSGTDGKSTALQAKLLLTGESGWPLETKERQKVLVYHWEVTSLLVFSSPLLFRQILKKEKFRQNYEIFYPTSGKDEDVVGTCPASSMEAPRLDVIYFFFRRNLSVEYFACNGCKKNVFSINLVQQATIKSRFVGWYWLVGWLVGRSVGHHLALRQTPSILVSIQKNRRDLLGIFITLRNNVRWVDNSC